MFFGECLRKSEVYVETSFQGTEYWYKHIRHIPKVTGSTDADREHTHWKVKPTTYFVENRTFKSDMCRTKKHDPIFTGSDDKMKRSRIYRISRQKHLSGSRINRIPRQNKNVGFKIPESHGKTKIRTQDFQDPTTKQKTVIQEPQDLTIE